jgi:hypothetical protein
VQGFTVRNATINAADAHITLLDTRKLLFENVQFTVPGNTVITNVTGENSADIQFKNCTPQKPEGWQSSAWNK